MVGEVTYFGNQPWPLPASLMLGFLGRASSDAIEVDGREIQDARWFTRAQMQGRGRCRDAGAARRRLDLRSLVEHWYGGALPGSW